MLLTSRLFQLNNFNCKTLGLLLQIIYLWWIVFNKSLSCIEAARAIRCLFRLCTYWSNCRIKVCQTSENDELFGKFACNFFFIDEKLPEHFARNVANSLLLTVIWPNFLANFFYTHKWQTHFQFDVISKYHIRSGLAPSSQTGSIHIILLRTPGRQS